MGGKQPENLDLSDVLLHAYESEAHVIGAVLGFPEVIGEIDGNALLPAFERHGEIWRSILDLLDRGEPVDAMTVHDDYMRRTRKTCGELLGTFAEAVVTGAEAKYHAKRMREAYARRQLVSIARMVNLEARDPAPLSDTIPTLIGQLFEIDVEPKRDRGMAELAIEIVNDVRLMRCGQKPPAIMTGLRTFDRMIGGLPPWLITIAARTSQGKSSYVGTLAKNCIDRGDKVGLIDGELGAKSIVRRLLAQESGIAVKDLREGRLSDDRLAKLERAAHRLREGDSFLRLKERERSWPAIKMHLRRMAADGAKVLIIDYLGMIEIPEESNRRPRNRHEDVARIAREARVLADDLQVPIVMVVQINREAMREKDKRPHLHNLRESGGVEEASNMVIMFHRPHLYDTKADPTLAECLVRKNTDGPTCTLELKYVPETTLFTDLDDAQAGMDFYGE